MHGNNHQPLPVHMAIIMAINIFHRHHFHRHLASRHQHHLSSLNRNNNIASCCAINSGDHLASTILPLGAIFISISRQTKYFILAQHWIATAHHRLPSTK
jgi:hypothetical protein